MAESPWQPIESAPKDGTEILVLIVSGGCVPIIRTAWWDDGNCVGREATPDEIGWWSYRHSVTQEMLVDHEQPKYWMPLPQLPEECR